MVVIIWGKQSGLPLSGKIDQQKQKQKTIKKKRSPIPIQIPWAKSDPSDLLNRPHIQLLYFFFCNVLISKLFKEK